MWLHYSRIAPDHAVAALLQEWPLVQVHGPLLYKKVLLFTRLHCCITRNSKSRPLLLLPIVLSTTFLTLWLMLYACFLFKGREPWLWAPFSPPFAVNTVLIASLASSFCTLFIVWQVWLGQLGWDMWSDGDTSCSGAHSNLCTTKTSGHNCASGSAVGL